MTRGEHDERYGPEPAVCDTLTEAKIESEVKRFRLSMELSLRRFLREVEAREQQVLIATKDMWDSINTLIEDATARQLREIEIGDEW